MKDLHPVFLEHSNGDTLKGLHTWCYVPPPSLHLPHTSDVVAVWLENPTIGFPAKKFDCGEPKSFPAECREQGLT